MRKTIWLLSLLLLGAESALAEFAIGPGITGAWYDPLQSGHEPDAPDAAGGIDVSIRVSSWNAP